ncbi:MAG TPA: TIGR02452 family protein [Burkholderiaceae bacterium]
MRAARDGRAALARETLAIVDAGRYVAPDGRPVDIGDAVRACVASTYLVLPEAREALAARVAAIGAFDADVAVELTAETTLAAARRLAGRGFACVGVLNFASARHPGGGFLGGSQAQEESLARSSALHASLTSPAAEPYYTHHRAERSLLYTDRVVVSPACPVVRDDDGTLLAEPHEPTFLTCAAPNAGAIQANQPESLARLPEVFARRMDGVLAAAVDAGCDALVLGAWGCGVFRNDPALVAALFRAWLAGGGPYARRFRHVCFAVFESSADKPCLKAFERAFGGPKSAPFE